MKKLNLKIREKYNNKKNIILDEPKNNHQYKIIENNIEFREKLIKSQSEIIYNIGDFYLKSSIDKLLCEGFNIKYEHTWSNKGFAVGTVGDTLNIYFFRNFFEKYQDNQVNYSKVMIHAGCNSLEGSIRSMLIHELGHVYYRIKNKNNKWLSLLRNSHSKEWSNWVALRLLNFNNMVKNVNPALMIGFTIFKGFNYQYDNPEYHIMKLLIEHYKNDLVKYGYIADRRFFPYINSPADW